MTRRATLVAVRRRPLPIRIRPAAEADLDAIAAILVEGFDGYRDFAPPRFEPPARDQHRDWLSSSLERDEVWLAVAEVDGRVVGHCSFLPASDSHWGSDDVHLAHFIQLFVARDSWGSGAAKALHDAALDAMAARGFERARLFTPTGQLRARRFYEREGWAAVRDLAAEDGPPLGLPVSEYRRELPWRRR